MTNQPQASLNESDLEAVKLEKITLLCDSNTKYGCCKAHTL